MKSCQFNNVSDIIADANYITEKALLPLSEVQTEKDKERYKKKGYLPGYTYTEWGQEYPFIPRDKVYYVNGLNVGTVYYDKKRVVYVNLNLYGTEMLTLNGPESFQQNIVQVIQTQEQHSRNKEYGYLFTTMPDGIKMDAMSHLLDLEGPTPLFYATFMDQYMTSNFICKNLSKRVVNALEKSKSDEQKEKTAQKVETLFDGKDSITVYRGEADGSTDYRQALSWSPNINVAYFFATRLGSNPALQTGKLFKKDVLEYFDLDGDDYGEEEILVLPGKVKRVVTLPLIESDSPVIKKMLPDVVDRYQSEKEVAVELYDELGRTGCHDVLHTKRVLFHSIVIGVHEHFSEREMNALCDAALYHDIGRKTDRREPRHGKASAEIYRKDNGCDAIVEFAIEMHCLDDEDAAEELNLRIPENERESARRVLTALKDADALDRVRFGLERVSSRSGLDVNQLRYSFSKQLVPLAMQCVRYLE